jgi:RHS repeat-associated protein
LLSLNNQTEGTQFYLFDALGSVVNLTKPDSSIQTRIQYDAWGNIRNQVGSSENEFGFTGHEMDEESGLIYMKARYYDPVLGQFLNEDSFEGSLKTPPSLNKYLYAAGNPVIYVDANGNFFILGNMADELAQMRNRTLDAAGGLSNKGSLRGAQRVSAGFAGVGAGVYDLLEGGLRTLNYAGNLAVEGAVRTSEFASSLVGIKNSGNTLSENYFIKSAREEFAASNAAIGKAYETITEHPIEVGAAVVNSVVETGAGIIEGDPGAIARGASTITETVGGGGVAGVGAKVGKQLLITAGKGVKKVADKTGEIAKKVADKTKNLTKKVIEKLGGVSDSANSTFFNVYSGGVRGEQALSTTQRAQVDRYLSNFELKDVDVRWVDDTQISTSYGNMFGQEVLNIGSDVIPGNVGTSTLTANSRISVNGTLAHEVVGHREAALAGRTQDNIFFEEAQASIRAARFAPDLSSTERFTLLRDAITRLNHPDLPGGPVNIRDIKDSLYIQNR